MASYLISRCEHNDAHHHQGEQQVAVDQCGFRANPVSRLSDAGGDHLRISIICGWAIICGWRSFAGGDHFEGQPIGFVPSGLKQASERSGSLPRRTRKRVYLPICPGLETRISSTAPARRERSKR
jgi:hypothetical protein